jgi:hypothetical protein
MAFVPDTTPAHRAHLNRRTLFGATAAMAVAATPVAARALAPMVSDEAYAYAVREGREINAIVARLNRGGYSDQEWEAWEARDLRFLTWAERLPLTPDFARAKAVAFASIYERNGGVDEFLDPDATTDVRLAFQVVKCLLGTN